MDLKSNRNWAFDSVRKMTTKPRERTVVGQKKYDHLTSHHKALVHEPLETEKSGKQQGSETLEQGSKLSNAME